MVPVFRRGGVARRLALCAAAFAAPSACVLAQQPTSPSSGSLLEGFQNPPDAARPRVWWHWMNGNITAAGITQDLEWMHRVGIRGFQNFDAAWETPTVVDQRLIYMTPGWKAAFRHAIQTGESLGFEMAVAGSPGWSESGGPWVRPEQAMKKVVWRSVEVEGGKPFRGVLPSPPTETGPIGNLARPDIMGGMGGEKPKAPVDYGRPTLTVAFRDPEPAADLAALHPVITTSSGAGSEAGALTDGDLNTVFTLPPAPGGSGAWIQYAFPQPVAVAAVTFAPGAPWDGMELFHSEDEHGPRLQSSDDGTTFHDVVRLPNAGAVQHTLSFAPVHARFFRLLFEAAQPGGEGSKAPQAHHVAEFLLHTGPRVNRREEKAGFAPLPDLYPFPTPQTADTGAIGKSDVLDLTAKVRPDGTLDWTPPPGHWTVLRMGFSLTGITNHPAPPEATGPEVDKLNRADVEAYINRYLDNYRDASGGAMGAHGLRYVITDSWEAGTENWTDDLPAQFRQRRGYDLAPWMPVLTGRVVGSAADSDRFLWDYRRTLAELLAENHYAVIAGALHARGMGQYGESHESGRATIGDGMEMKKTDDVPMAAMWTQRPGVNEENFGADGDIRESASVAHLYGQNLVAAESMTAAEAPWGWCPATLKPTADKELAMGLNRFVIHSSVHQPLTGPGGKDAGSPAPGLTLGPFGQWFNRNEVWAEQAAPWIDYLARSSWMLQQGKFVADIAYFYGEDSNITAIFAHRAPDVPQGHNYDFINADVLEHLLSVDNGALVTPSGMRYRALVLDRYAAHMSLPVLRRLDALVRGGAVVIGRAPVADPSLADDPAAFAKMVRGLWGASGQGGAVGKGKVYGALPVADALAQAGISPDTSYTRSQRDSQLLFVHRHTPGSELYFVDNRTPHADHTEATFAVTGRTPELWHPETGRTEPVSYTMANGKTTVPLDLDPWGTVFVVFGKPTAEASHREPLRTPHELVNLSGPWEVAFEENRGAPAHLHMDQLRSFSESADPGVRYFSGHATYTHSLEAPADWFSPGAQFIIDLGDVQNLAEVRLNGKALGTAWKPPFRVDLTGALHPGSNTLEIRVADLWVNRLIGDQQPAPAHKVTFTGYHPYHADSPLVPSGLLGPVRILAETENR